MLGRIVITATIIITATLPLGANSSRGAAFSMKTDERGILLTPLRPATIRAEQVSGPKEFNKGEILVCRQGNDVQKVTQGGEEVTVTQFKLTCGERVFILQAITFEEQ